MSIYVRFDFKADMNFIAALRATDATLVPSGFHHLASQRWKVVELAGFDR
jgi:hypothetical protein